MSLPFKLVTLFMYINIVYGNTTLFMYTNYLELIIFIPARELDNRRRSTKLKIQTQKSVIYDIQLT